MFTLLLFPTGRPPSARCRPVAVVAVVATAADAALNALQPAIELQDRDQTVDNPIGLAWAGKLHDGAAGGVVLRLLLACIVAAVVSVVLRFRRAQGVGRQQLKWFTYAAALLLLCLLVTEYLLPDGGVGDLLFGLAVAFVT